MRVKGRMSEIGAKPLGIFASFLALSISIGLGPWPLFFSAPRSLWVIVMLYSSPQVMFDGDCGIPSSFFFLFAYLSSPFLWALQFFPSVPIHWSELYEIFFSPPFILLHHGIYYIRFGHYRLSWSRPLNFHKVEKLSNCYPCIDSWFLIMEFNNNKYNN